MFFFMFLLSDIKHVFSVFFILTSMFFLQPWLKMIVHYLLALAYSEFSEVLSVKRFPVVEVTLKVIGSDTV